jgi:hypothetical protein
MNIPLDPSNYRACYAIICGISYEVAAVVVQTKTIYYGSRKIIH